MVFNYFCIANGTIDLAYPARGKPDNYALALVLQPYYNGSNFTADGIPGS